MPLTTRSTTGTAHAWTGTPEAWTGTPKACMARRGPVVPQDLARKESAVRLQLDRTDVEATLQPVERASMLPPAAFTDPAVLDWELENVYGNGWICAGHASAVAEPGSYITREIGKESFLVIGGEDGRPRAFHNVCRHRGSRILEESEGSVRKRLRCPYHAWSYDLGGRLRAAPHMDEVEDFDASCFGLREVRSAVVGGLLLIDLGGEAAPTEDHVGELLPLLERYRNETLRRGGLLTYQVKANWKGIAENYNECLHCPGVHPELNALSDYMSGEAYYGAGAWCGGSMTLVEGAETMGRNNGHGERPPIAGLEDSDLRNILYFSLFPNALVSLHPDYVMLHTLWPREPGLTDVICEFFFEPATLEAPGFDAGDAVGFWNQVNGEDWHVCELAQQGVASRGYSSGRYSAAEGDTHAFDAMVAASYLEGLREEARA
jgi:Rieske 2Fe-2S family protein